MKDAPIPFNEDLRLRELYSFDILDSEEEDFYNELANLAASACSCPLAMVSFIDEKRLWFKAEKEMGKKEIARGNSICNYTILQKEILVINDASKDDRFAHLPDIAGGLKIKFYAGAPIITKAGFVIGTVCVMDTIPKEISNEQLNSLRIIAKQVGKLLELRKRNNDIIKISQELINAEKKLATLNIDKREVEKLSTAYILKEKIAQSLIAIRFNIGFAQNSKELADEFLERSMTEIQLLTQDITDLSKSITPSTNQDDTYLYHIKQMIEEFELKNKTKVKFTYDEHLTCLAGNFGLNIFRICQDAMHFNELCKTDKISLQIKSGKKLTLICKYRHFHNDHAVLNERKMLEANILNRVEILNGKLSADIHKEKANTIKIEIPFP